MSQIKVLASEPSQKNGENKDKSKAGEEHHLEKKIREEIGNILRMYDKRLPFGRDEEEGREERHKLSVKTMTRIGGKIREETPQELCQADCITRGVIHGFGYSAIS